MVSPSITLAVPVIVCREAAWAPGEAARVATMNPATTPGKKGRRRLS